MQVNELARKAFAACPMTTAEKTRMLAERVMGWETRKSADGEIVAVINDGECACDVGFTPFSWTSKTWQPLTNLAHAGEVLEAMRANGLLVRINIEPDTNVVDVLSAEGDRMLFVACNPLSTAICHAALMTEGVKEEEL